MLGGINSEVVNGIDGRQEMVKGHYRLCSKECVGEYVPCENGYVHGVNVKPFVRPKRK
ncbi:hypothetical protein FACS189472_16340 [Alphaproteobacteria bacterium]|nr:hypothetical protein FACS189472_16340 [Alphaproteobacteria bacterium]